MQCWIFSYTRATWPKVALLGASLVVSACGDDGGGGARDAGPGGPDGGADAADAGAIDAEPAVDAMPGTLVVSAAALAVDEAGEQTLTIALGDAPAGSVEVQVSSSDTAAVAVEPASLRFDASDYQTPQVVTLSGVDDDNALDEAATVTFSAAGYISAVTEVTVFDREVQHIRPEPLALALTEGETGQFTLVLNLDPGAGSGVTVLMESSDPSAVSAAPLGVTLNQNNFDQPRTITVTALEDEDTVDELEVMINIVDDSGGLTTRAVLVSVTDNDTQAITFDNEPLQVDEGSSASFDVSLAFEPVGPVTVTITSGDDSALSLDKSTLTFDVDTYDQEQTVVIQGQEDDDADDELVTITASAPGLDDATFVVEANDND
ncbi:MAG: hypothetical protein Tsb0020_23090 [Haliangiales bacterium]